MNCRNCDHIVNGEFCSKCGQSSKIGRINYSNFLHEVSESVFQINKGFFYTLTEFYIRPGKSINEFLDGKRKNHFKPVAYAITLSTLYFLVTQVTNQNTWIDDLISGWLTGAKGQPLESQVPKILTWASKNYAYTALLVLPIFSLASYLSFLKFDKNYLEHLVINAYITGHIAIFYSVFAIAGSFIKNDLIEMFSIMVAIAYTGWVFWQLFNEGNRIINILRTLLTYTLYLIFSFIFLIAIFGINLM